MIKIEMMRWLNEIIITWLNELIFSRKNKKSDDLIIWSINWFLFHYIIIWFFMHERFDFESHLFIWDDSYRSFFTICWFRIESFYDHSIEMIFFKFTDFRDRRKINKFENKYAILMKSNRSDNEKRRWLNQKKKFSW
jgi:hypothetical protein